MARPPFQPRAIACNMNNEIRRYAFISSLVTALIFGRSRWRWLLLLLVLSRWSANGFGWTFRQRGSRIRPACFGLWTSIGISGVEFGSIRAANLIQLALIRPTRAQCIAPVFPPMFNPSDNMNHARHSTVSLSVKLPVKAAVGHGKFRRFHPNSLRFHQQFVNFPVIESMQ